MTAFTSHRDSYHHGDLRNALCDAATELARAGGPDAVVLREAARRVEVSATAAYRHFANHGELMHAVKMRGQRELADFMQAALDSGKSESDPGDEAERQLYAAGRAYIGFALTETGLFRTAFRHLAAEHPPTDLPVNDELQQQPGYQLLTQLIDALADTGRLHPARRSGAEVATWSAVHGLATLLLDGPLAMLSEEQRIGAIERTLFLMVSGLLAAQ